MYGFLIGSIFKRKMAWLFEFCIERNLVSSAQGSK